MVIKYNKGTGKYYIAPSPPSFYQSPGSSSGGSSSGGSSSGSSDTKIVNGVTFIKTDTGGWISQGAKANLQKSRERIASGGDPYSWNTGRSTGGTTTAQIIQNAVSNKNTGTNLNIPNLSTIRQEETAGRINKTTALGAIGLYYSQDYQSQYNKANQQYTKKLFSGEEKKRDVALRYYQNRINSGENFNIVTKEYNAYIDTSNSKLLQQQKEFGANWEATTGKTYKQSANKIMYDQSLIYDTEKAQANVKNTFISGAKTGAVTTGAFQVLSKYAPRVASFGSKFVAVPLMVGYAGYAYYSSGSSGYKNYQTAKGLGFTDKQALQRGLLSGANTLSGPAFFSAGAVTGGLAVAGSTMAYKNLRMTGRITGYSSVEQGRIDKLLNRKDAFKTTLRQGQVTDATAKGGGARISAGSSSRSYDVSLDMTGLKGKNLATAKKLNLRSEERRVGKECRSRWSPYH